jgi:uncharacterized protein (TIGR03437 family)
MSGSLAFAVFFSLAPVALFPQISLPDQSTSPSTSLVMPVMFSPEDGVVSGLQFDLEYDSSVMSVVAVAGDVLRKSGKSIYYSDLGPNKRRFVIVGLNQNPIPSGAPMNLFVNLNSNATGIYALTFSNVVSTDPSGHPVRTTSTGGAVNVQANTGSRLQRAGVLSAASLVAGPVAPGEIVTLIGSSIGPDSAVQAISPNDVVLGRTSVLFDGYFAPLLYAARNQINAVVPYEVAGQANTRVSITSGGQLIADVPLAVAAAAPAIFTLDSSGVGPGGILNQDTTVNSNSNPAARGSVVVLFATGAGQTNPASDNGQITSEIPPHSVLPVLVRIGGMEAEVTYSGGAPGLIAGVVQVNCKVPEELDPGDSVPVVLIVGGIESPPGVTLAVR